jgi:hypothetical protein
VTTPLRSLPADVDRWTSRVRYLRWLDALAGVLAPWAALAAALPGVTRDVQGFLALGMLGLLALVPPASRSGDDQPGAAARGGAAAPYETRGIDTVRPTALNTG